MQLEIFSTSPGWINNADLCSRGYTDMARSASWYWWVVLSGAVKSAVVNASRGERAQAPL